MIDVRVTRIGGIGPSTVHDEVQIKRYFGKLEYLVQIRITIVLSRASCWKKCTSVRHDLPQQLAARDNDAKTHTTVRVRKFLTGRPARSPMGARWSVMRSQAFEQGGLADVVLADDDSECSSERD